MDIKTGIDNYLDHQIIARRLGKEVYCGICGSPVDVQVIKTEKGAIVGWTQSCYKGRNYPVCRRCFQFNLKWNDRIFRIARFLWGKKWIG